MAKSSILFTSFCFFGEKRTLFCPCLSGAASTIYAAVVQHVLECIAIVPPTLTGYYSMLCVCIYVPAWACIKMQCTHTHMQHRAAERGYKKTLLRRRRRTGDGRVKNAFLDTIQACVTPLLDSTLTDRAKN